MSVRTKDELSPLHSALAKALLARIQHNDCSSADFAVAAKFLKDNDIVAVEGKDEAKNKETAELEAALAKRKRPMSRLTQADFDDALAQTQYTGNLQ